jgi:hypothetical protein
LLGFAPPGNITGPYRIRIATASSITPVLNTAAINPESQVVQAVPILRNLMIQIKDIGSRDRKP